MRKADVPSTADFTPVPADLDGGEPPSPLAMNAVRGNRLMSSIVRHDRLAQLEQAFSHEIDVKVKPTDQQRSGRCWLFAYVNVLRVGMVRDMKLPDTFQLSQTYLHFYDKLERANTFLRLMHALRDLPDDDRLVHYLCRPSIQDGGFHNYAEALADKYGVVPYECMPDRHHSANTGEMNAFLDGYLRQCAHEIRHSREGADLDGMLARVRRILVLFLGEPPRTVEWRTPVVVDKSKKRGKEEAQPPGPKPTLHVSGMSPRAFRAKYCGEQHDMVVLSNYGHLKEYEPYRVLCADNVSGSDAARRFPTRFVNVPVREMRKAVRRSIRAGVPVWFTGDVQKYASSSMGVLDREAFDYAAVFGFDPVQHMGKESAMRMGVTEPCHAMAFVGYDKEDRGGDEDGEGRRTTTARWLVENSWGDVNGKGGRLVMGSSWFDDFVVHVAVRRAFLGRKAQRTADRVTKAELLWPWEAGGAAVSDFHGTST